MSITLELSTDMYGGTSDVLVMAYALSTYKHEEFKNWDGLNEESKADGYDRMVEQLRVLTDIEANLCIKLAETVQSERNTINPSIR